MRHKLLAAVFLLVAAFPLAAAEPTPRQRELIEQLFKVIHFDRTLASIVDAVYGQVQNRFVQEAADSGDDPDRVADAGELFETFRAEAAKVDFSTVIREPFIEMYAKYFTEEELAALNAFYATPAGQKTISVMADLMRDGMQIGGEKLGPKIDEVMNRAIAVHAPRREARADLRRVAAALEVYRVENARYPAGDYASLRKTLDMDEFPEKDGWDHAYRYEVSADGRTYRLVSAGADAAAADDIVIEPPV